MPSNQIKKYWLLKDAIGSTQDILTEEPTRHTIDDFIPVLSIPEASDTLDLMEEIKIGDVILKRQINGEFWIIKNSVQSAQLTEDEEKRLSELFEALLVEKLTK